MTNVAKYAKAIVALIIAFLGALGTALTPDTAGLSTVTALEWISIAITTLTAAGTVWAVPNKTESLHDALTESVQLDVTEDP